MNWKSNDLRFGGLAIFFSRVMNQRFQRDFSNQSTILRKKTFIFRILSTVYDWLWMPKWMILIIHSAKIEVSEKGISGRKI